MPSDPGRDLADIAAALRIAGRWRGTYLDLFLYPESRLDSPDAELLPLRGGTVLFERDRAGQRLLAALDGIFARGPEPLAADERAARRRWAWKMWDRAAKGDAEGNFRRAWLLYALLEDYFHLRGAWYLGPKKALAQLQSSRPEVYSIFEAALRPGATPGEIARAVEAVAGPREEDVDRELMDDEHGAEGAA